MDKKRIKELAAKEPHQLSDKDWEGQSDASTLLRAEMIKGDSAKLKRAKEWAAVLLERDNAEKAVLQKIIDG